MRRIVLGGVIVGVTAVLSFAALGRSGGQDPQQQTLAGLQSVTVMVAELDPKLRDYGLATWALQTRVESQLRESGIPVSSQSIAQAQEGFLVVEIRVDSSNQLSGLCALRYDVMFMQPVRLLSNGSMVVPAETWAKRGVKLVRSSLLAQTTASKINTCVRQFADDYLAANGR